MSAGTGVKVIQTFDLKEPYTFDQPLSSCMCLCHKLCEINVKEICIETGLDEACDDGDWIEVTFREIPPDPIGYIQSSVESERKEVVRCDVFRFSSPLKHEQLRQDCHCL